MKLNGEGNLVHLREGVTRPTTARPSPYPSRLTCLNPLGDLSQAGGWFIILRYSSMLS